MYLEAEIWLHYRIHIFCILNYSIEQDDKAGFQEGVRYCKL
jgi:hypothetical protein